jgi:uncharacterized membrane protein YccC
MTDAAAPPTPVGRPWSALADRFVRRDPGLLVVKRSLRAAVVVPSLFALTHGLFSNPQISLFAAFGSFAVLLLVEFTGPPRSRLISYTCLYVVGVVNTVVGTVVSTHAVAAVLTTAAVGFIVLFSGVVAPAAATASTAVLLTFVLPVAVAQPASAVGPRLLGWTLAAFVGTAAAMVVWPPPWHDDLRRRLASTVSALARLANLKAEGRSDYVVELDVRTELTHLRRQFSATPYPPTGAASSAVALSKLVGRVEWVASNAALTDARHWVTDPPAAHAVTEQVAETLRRTAAVICDAGGHPIDDAASIDALQAATEDLADLISVALDAGASALTSAPVAEPEAGTTQPVDELASALDPGFHARALGTATEMVADAALEAAGASAVIDRRLGLTDETTSQTFVHRVLSHLSFRSVWFRNAIRGAFGLAVAVAVVEVTNVQHGFWVVLGTMSVLRSNALGTGATAVRAIGGTAIGFVVGGAIMVGVADHTVFLWVLLPLAVFFAGVAPSMISFVASQAAFSVTVIVLFNIIQPVGWRVGLTRIEDVAIGCGVSIVVGLLFWPRGATAALGRALADAFAANSGYLADAVERLTRTSRVVDVRTGQRRSHRAYLLVDDAFRQYFAERGAKVVSVETISGLFTGSNRLRLAAYTLASLPVHSPAPGLEEVESVAIAEAVLRDSYGTSHRWYQEFADMLAGRRTGVEEPPQHDAVLHDVLRTAFDDVGAQHRSDRAQTALQMLWADELLETQSRLQADLIAAADLFMRGKRRSVLV